MKKKKDNQNRILNEFFIRPTYKFNIRELARCTGLNPNTVLNWVNLFEKEGIVKKKIKENRSEVFLNLDNNLTIRKKRIYNLAKTYDSGIVDFLAEKYSPLSISIIGSYSKGEDIEKSDIDIVVITNKKETINLTRFEKLFRRKLHFIVEERKNLSEEFFNNLINGIVLYGALRA